MLKALRQYRRIAVVVLMLATAPAMWAGNAGADDYPLQSRRLGSANDDDPEAKSLDRWAGMTAAQSFEMRFTTRLAIEDDKEVATHEMQDRKREQRRFNAIVTKEPSTYNAKWPLRDVVTLGDRQYAFACDTAKPAPSNVEAYSRLYFDRNGNGDLTDDPVVDGKSQNVVFTLQLAPDKSPTGGKSDKDKKDKDEENKKNREFVFRRMALFPPVDLEIEIDGKKAAYSFEFRTESCFSRHDRSYVEATLGAASYRVGRAVLDGQARSILLVDSNSNGRFDDAWNVMLDRRDSDGFLYLERGDWIYVDPKPADNLYRYLDWTTIQTRHEVAQLFSFAGRYYRLKVAPDGSRLSLEPFPAAAVGHVANPNERFDAMVYGDGGLVRISGTKDQPVPLPAGQWKVLEYLITATGPQPTKPSDPRDAKSTDPPDAKEGSAKKPQEPPRVTAKARVPADYPAVKVSPGETVAMPFGPPYKPTIVVQRYDQKAKTLALNLRITGSVGEEVHPVLVDGKRYKKPELRIIGPDGAVVAEARFEYG